MTTLVDNVVGAIASGIIKSMDQIASFGSGAIKSVDDIAKPFADSLLKSGKTMDDLAKNIDDVAKELTKQGKSGDIKSAITQLDNIPALKSSLPQSSFYKYLKDLAKKVDDVPVASVPNPVGSVPNAIKVADNLKGAPATAANLATSVKFTSTNTADFAGRIGGKYSKDGSALVLKNGQRIQLDDLGKMGLKRLESLNAIPKNASTWSKIGAWVERGLVPVIFIGVMLPGLIFSIKDRSGGDDNGNGKGNGDASENCKATTVTGICSLDEFIQNLFPNASPGDALMYIAGACFLCLCLCCCSSCMMSMMMMSSKGGGNSYNA